MPPVDRSREARLLKLDRERQQQGKDRNRIEQEYGQRGLIPHNGPVPPSPARKYKKNSQNQVAAIWQEDNDAAKPVDDIPIKSKDISIDNMDIPKGSQDTPKDNKDSQKDNEDAQKVVKEVVKKEGSPKVSMADLQKDVDTRLKEATSNLTEAQMLTLKKLQESPAFLKMVDMMIQSNQNLTEMLQSMLSEHTHTHHGIRNHPKPVGMRAAVDALLKGGLFKSYKDLTKSLRELP